MSRKTVLIIALLLLAPMVAVAANMRSVGAVETLKVGVLVPYNLIQGDAYTGGAEGGAILAAMDINAAGGINIGGTTYMIELVKNPATGKFYDECAYPLNPSQAYLNTKALIDAGCKFIIGGFRTECTWEIMRAIAEHNAEVDPKDWVIYLINGASTDDLCVESKCKEMTGVDMSFAWRFRINPINSTMLFKNTLGWLQGYLLPRKLIPLFGTVKFACIAESLEWTEKICWYFANVGLGPNTQFVGCARTPPGTTDFEPYLDELKRAGANLVCHFYTLPDAQNLVTKWREKEYPFLLVGIDVFGQAAAWPYMTGGACEYEMTEDFAGTRTPITPLAVQFWDHFVGNFSPPAPNPPAWPVYTAWGAYNAFLTIKSCLETADTLDSTVIISTLESLETLVLNGKAKFTSTHDVYSLSYGPTWPDGYTRALYIQWVKVGGVLIKNVVCPVDQQYSRKCLIPPWIYTLGQVDLDFSKLIDIFDIVQVGLAFGANPGDPNWNVEADVTADGLIDIFDIVQIALVFGATAEPVIDP
jgi:ABC-type branched-subunit amino acid transport system substrate-binding protein